MQVVKLEDTKVKALEREEVMIQKR